MPAASLTAKLKLKAGLQASVINAPQGYLQALMPLPDGVIMGDNLEAKLDWVQVFVSSKTELEDLVPLILAALKLESIL